MSAPLRPTAPPAQTSRLILPAEGERLVIAEPETPEALRPLTLAELFALDIPAPAMLLDPILTEKGLGMLYAPRGIGKTLLALSISYAVATGGTLFKWRAPAARAVLHVDGEMPLSMLRTRLAGIVGGAGIGAGEIGAGGIGGAGQAPGAGPSRHGPAPAGPAPDGPAAHGAALDGPTAHGPAETFSAAFASGFASAGNFRLLAADQFDSGLPNLCDPAAQEEIEALLDGVALLTLDNLSTLAATDRDNDADSWTPMQDWLLKLRRRGLAVLLIHHAGKGGLQRGTSRREDVLDTVIALKRPADYIATQGARFEVHFDKLRGVWGAQAAPFEAKLEDGPRGLLWSTKAVGEAAGEGERAGEGEGEPARTRATDRSEEIRSRAAAGMTNREIAEELGLSRSAVQRLIAQLGRKKPSTDP